MKQLTDIKIKKLSNKGRHHDGLGLYLNVGKTQKKNWSFQYTCNSKKQSVIINQRKQYFVGNLFQLLINNVANIKINIALWRYKYLII